MAISTISAAQAVTYPGAVLQVVQATNTTEFSTTSGTYVSTGLTATITPKFATSKILVMVSTPVTNITASYKANLTIYRNSTNLNLGGTGFTFYQNNITSTFGYVITPAFINYLDSPATTSATTYTLYCMAGGAGTTYTMINGYSGQIQLLEIAA